MWQVIAGNPAVIVGYAQATSASAQAAATTSVAQTQAGTDSEQLLPTGARLLSLPYVRDLRGSLSVGELGKHLPFAPNRYFLVFDVPNAEVRGEHAHRLCHQFFVCVVGHCNAVVDDGKQGQEVRLDRKTLGLYMPPMTWGVQYKYSADAVLMVLASHVYDPSDYIRDYSEFLALTTKRQLQLGAAC